MRGITSAAAAAVAFTCAIGAQVSVVATGELGATASESAGGMECAAIDGADGVFNAVWASREAGDTDISHSRSHDGGLTWSAPALLTAAMDTDSSHQTNPVIATDGAGNWMVLCVSGSGLQFTVSEDGGETWAERIAIVGMIGQPARIALAHHEARFEGAVVTTAGNALTSRTIRTYAIASEDSGENWQVSLLNTQSFASSLAVFTPALAHRGDGISMLCYLNTTTATGATAAHREHFADEWVKAPFQFPAAQAAEFRISSAVSAEDFLLVYPQGGMALYLGSIAAGGAFASGAALFPDREGAEGSDGWPVLRHSKVGMLLLSFQSDKDLDGAGEDGDVWYSSSSDGGSNWHDPAPVNADADSDTAVQRNVALATDNLGSWVSLWKQSEETATTSSPWSLHFTTFVEDQDPRVIRFRPSAPLFNLSAIPSVDIRFSEPMVDVGLEDFAFSTSDGALSGTPFFEITAEGYLLSFPNAAGTGAINVSLKPGNDIVDAEGNPLTPYDGQASLVIDKEQPVLTQITVTTPDPVYTGALVSLDIAFSDEVVGFTMSDLSFQAIGGTIDPRTLSGNGANYQLTVRAVDSSDNDTPVLCSVSLAETAAIADTAQNPVPASNLSAHWEVLYRPVVVQSILPSAGDAMTGSPKAFTVQFSEAVQGFDQGDLVIPPGSAVVGVTGGPISFNANINFSVAGEHRIRIPDNAAISSTFGIPLSAGAESPAIVVRTPLVAQQYEFRDDSVETDEEAVLDIVFNRPVSGVDIGDFSITPTGTTVGSASMTGGPQAYEMRLSDFSTPGQVSVRLMEGHGIVDEFGLGPTFAPTYFFALPVNFNVIANNPPRWGYVDLLEEKPHAKFSLWWSELMQGFTISDVLVTADGITHDTPTLTGPDNNGRFRLTLPNLIGTGTVTIGPSESYGCTGLDGDPCAVPSEFWQFELDHSPPSLQEITRSAATVVPGETVTFTYVFDESVVVPEGALEVTAQGVTYDTIQTTGTEDSRMVEISNVQGDGTLRATIDPTYPITDDQGAVLLSTSLQSVVSVGEPRVELLSLTRLGSPAVNGGNVQFAFVFSEPIANADTTDCFISTTGSAGFAQSSAAVAGNTLTLTLQGVYGNGQIFVALSGSSDIQGESGRAISQNSLNATVDIDTTHPPITMAALAEQIGVGESAVIQILSDGPIVGIESAADLEFLFTLPGADSVQFAPLHEGGISLTIGPLTGVGLLGVGIHPDAQITDLAGNAVQQLPPPVFIHVGGEYHQGDANGDWRMDLSETMRLVQFYNAGKFGCDAGTEDGYTPTSTDTTCAPHSADYDPQDWTISLSELLRAVQYLNLGGIYQCPDATPPSEDGYCAYAPLP